MVRSEFLSGIILFFPIGIVIGAGFYWFCGRRANNYIVASVIFALLAIAIYFVILPSLPEDIIRF